MTRNHNDGNVTPAENISRSARCLCALFCVLGWCLWKGYQYEPGQIFFLLLCMINLLYLYLSGLDVLVQAVLVARLGVRYAVVPHDRVRQRQDLAAVARVRQCLRVPAGKQGHLLEGYLA